MWLGQREFDKNRRCWCLNSWFNWRTQVSDGGYWRVSFITSFTTSPPTPLLFALFNTTAVVCSYRILLGTGHSLHCCSLHSTRQCWGWMYVNWMFIAALCFLVCPLPPPTHQQHPTTTRRAEDERQCTLLLSQPSATRPSGNFVLFSEQLIRTWCKTNGGHFLVDYHLTMFV